MMVTRTADPAVPRGHIHVHRPGCLLHDGLCRGVRLGWTRLLHGLFPGLFLTRRQLSRAQKLRREAREATRLPDPSSSG